MARASTFARAVLIAQDGKVLLSKGYGLADRAQGIANTPQTRFHLGSMSKQFTAMGILILQSQGKLSVQDPICNYYPEDELTAIMLTNQGSITEDTWVAISNVLFGEE